MELIKSRTSTLSPNSSRITKLLSEVPSPCAVTPRSALTSTSKWPCLRRVSGQLFANWRTIQGRPFRCHGCWRETQISRDRHPSPWIDSAAQAHRQPPEHDVFTRPHRLMSNKTYKLTTDGENMPISSLPAWARRPSPSQTSITSKANCTLLHSVCINPPYDMCLPVLEG